MTDPRWEIYLLVRKDQEDRHFRLLGFAAVYRFNRYPDGKRLRLGQVCSSLCAQTLEPQLVVFMQINLPHHHSSF